MRPHLFFPLSLCLFCRPSSGRARSDRHALSNTLSLFPRSSFHRYCPSLRRARYSSPDSPRRRRGKCQVRARRRSRIFGREIGHPLCLPQRRLHIVTGRSLGLLQRRNGYVCSPAAAVPSFLFPPLRALGHTQIVLRRRRHPSLYLSGFVGGEFSTFLSSARRANI